MTDMTAQTSAQQQQQHNYSNISPSVQTGPASLASSSNMSSAFTPTNFASHPPPPIPTSQPPPDGTLRSVPSRHRLTPPAEKQRRREKALAEELKKSKLADIDDLIQLQGPLTEDAVLKTLQARFYNQKCQVYHLHLSYHSRQNCIHIGWAGGELEIIRN